MKTGNQVVGSVVNIHKQKHRLRFSSLQPANVSRVEMPIIEASMVAIGLYARMAVALAISV